MKSFNTCANCEYWKPIKDSELGWCDTIPNHPRGVRSLSKQGILEIETPENFSCNLHSFINLIEPKDFGDHFEPKKEVDGDLNLWGKE